MSEWFIIKNYPKYKIFSDGKVFSDYSFKFLRHCKDENGSYVRLYENKKMCKFFIKDLLKEYFNKDESNFENVKKCGNEKKCNCVNVNNCKSDQSPRFKKMSNSKPLYMRECLIK